MLLSLMLQIKVFILIVACFVVLSQILHTIAVFVLKDGKIFDEKYKSKWLVIALSYIITILITGV